MLGKGELIDSIRKFESSIIDREDERRRLSQGPVLRRVVGSKLKVRRLKSIRKKHLPRIQRGRRYGFLKVSETGGRHTRTGVLYPAACDCGTTLEMSTMDLHHRAVLDVGCMGEECPYGSLEAKVWFNPKFALWVQLSFLLSNKPEEVDNSWGGHAYEELERVISDEGQETFILDVWPKVRDQIEDKCWWMHRTNPLLPYSKVNVFFDRSPDPEIIQVNLDTVRYGHMLYTLQEVADLFCVPLERVEELRKGMISDNALMDKLIEEGEV
jgi:hypothetical protein